MHTVWKDSPANTATDSRCACAASVALVSRVLVARIPEKKEGTMGNVIQLGVVPIWKRLKPEEITALENAGVHILVLRRNGHFCAAVGPTQFDSRQVVGCDDPIAFTLRAIAAHLEQSARQLLEMRLERSVVERWTGNNG